MRVADTVKLLQTAMHWQNRLFLTLQSLTFNLFFLSAYNCMLFTNKKALSDVIGACAQHYVILTKKASIQVNVKTGVTTLVIFLLARQNMIQNSVYVRWTLQLFLNIRMIQFKAYTQISCSNPLYIYIYIYIYIYLMVMWALLVR